VKTIRDWKSASTRERCLIQKTGPNVIKPIYLDDNGTTPHDPEDIEAHRIFRVGSHAGVREPGQ